MGLDNSAYYKILKDAEWSPLSYKEIANSLMKNGVKQMYHAIVNEDDIQLFSLGLGQNQSFGPKQNTKFGVRTTHPPPKTFWRIPGIVGGQDLACRLPIVQGATAHSFDPPRQIFLTQKCFGTKFF